MIFFMTIKVLENTNKQNITIYQRVFDDKELKMISRLKVTKNELVRVYTMKEKELK